MYKISYFAVFFVFLSSLFTLLQATSDEHVTQPWKFNINWILHRSNFFLVINVVGVKMPKKCRPYFLLFIYPFCQGKKNEEGNYCFLWRRQWIYVLILSNCMSCGTYFRWITSKGDQMKTTDFAFNSYCQCLGYQAACKEICLASSSLGYV